MGPLQKRNCCQSCQRAHDNIKQPQRGRALLRLTRRAPSKNKLLPKRANNIQLPERAPAEAVKTDPSEKNAKKVLNNVYCRSRPVYTYCKSFGAGGPHKKVWSMSKRAPPPKRAPSPKRAPPDISGGSADPFDPPWLRPCKPRSAAEATWVRLCPPESVPDPSRGHRSSSSC